MVEGLQSHNLSRKQRCFIRYLKFIGVQKGMRGKKEDNKIKNRLRRKRQRDAQNAQKSAQNAQMPRKA